MHPVGRRNTGPKAVACALLTVALAGCGLFDGRSGNDSSKFKISKECQVELKQAERVAGKDDADVVESIAVSPDCLTEIKFRQTIGNSVDEIEDEGATQVLGDGVPDPEGD